MGPRDAAKPGERVQVIARTKNEILATGIADIHRPDLEEAGIGDGRHAFELIFQKCGTDRVFIETVETAQVARGALCNGNVTRCRAKVRALRRKC